MRELMAEEKNTLQEVPLEQVLDAIYDLKDQLQDASSARNAAWGVWKNAGDECDRLEASLRYLKSRLQVEL